MSVIRTLLLILLEKAKLGGASEIKMNKFILYFSRLALIFAEAVDRLRLGIKNKLAYFVLLSTCTIFATCKCTSI